MLSNTVTWKYVLPILLLLTLTGGAIGGVVARFALESKDADLTRGTTVYLGPVDSLHKNPFCVESQHFCVAQLETGSVALYTYDTHPRFRTQGCQIRWLEDFIFEDPETGEVAEGWFRGECSGSTFRLSGELVFGPSPRDMDRFPLTVQGPSDSDPGSIHVDTTRLVCGLSRGDSDEDCAFAPLPQ